MKPKMTRPSMIARLLLSISLSVVLAGGADADVYKWVDKDGKVQYSDSPPLSGDAKKMKRKTKEAANAVPASSGAAAKPATSIADQELEFRKRKMGQEEAEKKKLAEKELAEKNKGYCSNLRGELQSNKDGRRIVKYSEKGERQFLDDAERAKSRTELEQAIARDCK